MRIVCDIGGTKIRIAKVIDKQLQDVLIADTPQKYDEGLKFITEYFDKNKSEEIIIGIAGNLNQAKNSLVFSPNLPDWVGKDILSDLKEKTKLEKIIIENDTALVGLGEALNGAGKGLEIVVYITVSTGVGGVRIVNGKIDKNRFGFEPGHQIIDADSTIKSADGGHSGMGHLDNLISGRALKEITGQNPKDITDPELWNSVTEELAIGLHNTILHWSPDIVVLGGSMIVGDPAIDIGKLEKILKEKMKTFPDIPKIKKAELGDVGGLIGGSQIVL